MAPPPHRVKTPVRVAPESGNGAQIAALERKVGQLTMELDVLKMGLRAVPPTTSAPLSLISGPSASASRKDADS